MNNHQSLKAEIDAREENFAACISLGRELLNRKHYASSEIEKKLIKLTTERAEMMRRWEDRWEYLQLSECDVSSVWRAIGRTFLFTSLSNHYVHSFHSLQSSRCINSPATRPWPRRG